MARKTEPRAPESAQSAASVAPLEVVKTGIDLANADLVARLTRQSDQNATVAGLKQKLASAQQEVMQQAGVDFKALVSEARKLFQRGPGTPPEHISVPPGLQPQLPVAVAQVPGFSVVRPPYNYDWMATGYIHYGPGTLSAQADRQTGALSFAEVPGSDQATASYAAAAVGISFRPLTDGLLTVATDPNITDSWFYYSFFTGSNTRGWVGFLVQAYDTKNALVGTPIYQQVILFDQGSTGSILPACDGAYDSLSPIIVTPTFVVSSQLWYAIWFWCGGDIHGEGSGYYSDSFAWATLDASVPFLLLYQP